MSIRFTRNRTIALSTLLLLAVGAAPSFFMRPAPGEPMKPATAESASLSVHPEPARSAAVTNKATASQENKAPAQLEETEIVDLSVIYPPEGKNPTDDPLAIFNTPIQ